MIPTSESVFASSTESNPPPKIVASPVELFRARSRIVRASSMSRKQQNGASNNPGTGGRKGLEPVVIRSRSKDIISPLSGYNFFLFSINRSHRIV